MDFIALWLNDIVTFFLFPFIYFLHSVLSRSVNQGLQDMRGDYQHLYTQVAGLRERIVKLEENFTAHDKKEMEKYTQIKEQFDAVNQSIRRQ